MLTKSCPLVIVRCGPLLAVKCVPPSKLPIVPAEFIGAEKVTITSFENVLLGSIPIRSVPFPVPVLPALQLELESPLTERTCQEPRDKAKAGTGNSISAAKAPESIPFQHPGRRTRCEFMADSLV
jgi:hypothetical protein